MLNKYIHKIIGSFSRSLCSYRGRKLFDSIELVTDRFHRILNNVDFNMERNGELRVLEILSKSNMKCIFDVGANIGEWSQIASRLNPKSLIYAFEIIPSTYEVLLKNTKHISNIIPNNIGLSNKAETINMYLGADSSMSSSCKIEGMQEHNTYYSESIKCNTLQASAYLIENKIETIDFVKIDVEGMDLKVIQGFENRIRCVRVFQFEYGIFNIASHDLLADFCKFFYENGYVVGKIFPNCVKFFDYHFDMENFHGSNYLAIRNDEVSLIEKMKSFGM